MLHHGKSLKGFGIHATDGEIGHVSDIYFEDRGWHVRYFVVSTGNWLMGREVLLSPVVVEAAEPHHLRVRVTREQVKDSPDVSTSMPVSRQHEVELAAYYNWPGYWPGPFDVATGYVLAPAPLPAPVPEAHEPIETSGPNLRSLREVSGYTLEATDGGAGHVDDLIVDDRGWDIPQILGVTHSLLPGRKFLLPRSAVDHIDWAERTFFLNITKRQTELAPEA